MRVVDQAESIECLIFLAKINVQPGVEGLSVFLVLRRNIVIAEQRGGVGRRRIKIQEGDGIWIQSASWNDIQIAPGQRIGKAGGSVNWAGAGWTHERLAHKSGSTRLRGSRIQNGSDWDRPA